MNSFCHKRVHRRWTWESIDGRTNIDYFVTDKKYIFEVITVLKCFSTGSNHRQMRFTIKVYLEQERNESLNRKKNKNMDVPDRRDEFKRK